METARLIKRIWVYVINLILYLGIGFLSCIPFVALLKVPTVLYLHIAFCTAIILSLFIDYLILVVSKGFTIGSAIMGVKYVSSDGNRLNHKQCMVRSCSESIVIFAVMDLIYFIKYRTERGVIDRLSDSFAIDTRI